MIAQASAAQRAAPGALLQQHRRRGRRRLHQHCRADTGWGTPQQPPCQPSRDEMQARIKKTHEYKKGGSPAAGVWKQPPSSAAAAAAAAALRPPQPQPKEPAQRAPVPPAQAHEPALESALPFHGSTDIEQSLGQAAQQLAALQEAQFLQAVTEASSSSSSVPPVPAARQAASRKAVLAQMEAARRYKQQQSGSTTGGEGAAGGASPAPAFGFALPPPSGTLPQAESEVERQRSFSTDSGGAQQAANWLVSAEKPNAGSGAGAIDQSLSAEQFTIAKEELKKQQRVEIITANAAWVEQVRQEKQAAAGGSAAVVSAVEENGEDLHKPKVPTWGVFPRPRNISEAYGGGRNLRPGQALEPEEAAREREQRVSAKLKEYRKSAGLDIDPAVEAQAQALYNEGTVLFDEGHISLALPKFAAASELMVLRSRLGGEARLQQAICLDSLGQNQDAYELYRCIEGHSTPGVAKKAKRMLFGWKAAENLKTANLSYQSSTEQWKRYFDVINRNAAYAVYVASEEEEEQVGAMGSGFTVAVALGAVLLSLGLVAYRALAP